MGNYLRCPLWFQLYSKSICPKVNRPFVLVDGEKCGGRGSKSLDILALALALALAFVFWVWQCFLSLTLTRDLGFGFICSGK